MEVTVYQVLFHKISHTISALLLEIEKRYPTVPILYSGEERTSSIFLESLYAHPPS